MLDFVLHTHGPEFLVVFIAYAAFVTAALWLLQSGWFSSWKSRAGGEGGHSGSVAAASPLSKIDAKDPYEVAYLVDGARGVIRAGITALHARGIIKPDGEKLAVKADGKNAKDLPTVERALMDWCKDGKAGRLLLDGSLRNTMEGHMWAKRKRLEAMGLLTSNDDIGVRILQVMLALFLVPGLGLLKVNSALERGHHNVEFLIILSVVSAVFIVAAAIKRARLTPQGRRARHELLDEMAVIGKRAWRKDSTDPEQLALVAGVCGFGFLVGTPFESFADSVRPVSASGSCSSSCASSGSSCSSSCGGGSSCGSGCGGGGCGGCGGGGD